MFKKAIPNKKTYIMKLAMEIRSLSILYIKKYA